MRISFRQGIVRHQTDVNNNPTFLQKTGNFITLNVSPDFTIIAFAHGDADYLYSESVTVQNAWGPFIDTNIDYWLYWDLNMVTGVVTHGFTTKEPVESATAPQVFPNDPGQMWWDTTKNKMFEWNGAAWIEKIRVFACKLEDGTNIVSMSINAPSFVGTQVGLNQTVFAGALIFDHTGKPIRTGDNKQFFTTEYVFTSGVPTGASLRVNNILIPGQAVQPIGAYNVVQLTDFNKIMPADPLQQGRAVYGIIEEDAHQGDVVNYVTEGVIYNEQWDWVAEGATVNTPVYVETGGNITLQSNIPNQLPIGVVIDRQSILFAPGMFPQVTISAAGGDHGELSGLEDDDHPQYHTDARGDARYYTQEQLNLGVLDTRYYTESEIDNLLSGKSNISHTHAGLIPPGGGPNDVLTKVSASDYDFTWAPGGSGGGAWGSITGTLSDQTDLQNALNGKAPVVHQHVKADIIDATWVEVLNDLTDVDTTPTNGQVLTYDAPNSKWIAADGSSVNVLFDLQDVGVTDFPLADDQVLFYINGQWTNAPLPTIPETLPDLTDVAQITPANDDMLIYDQSINQWTTAPAIKRLDDLVDVAVAAPADDQILYYDALNALWMAKTFNASNDHSALINLTNDDHPQYHTDARGDARYYQKNTAAVVGNLVSFGAGDTLSDTSIAAADVATIQYINSVLNGLKWKKSVRVATDSNIDLTTGGLLTVDGIALAAGDRVLVMNQTNPAENGIYIAGTGAWTRAEDMDSITPIDEVNGAAVYVEEGTNLGDKGYTVISQVSTLDTDPLLFALFNGASALPSGQNCEVLVYNDTTSTWQPSSPLELPRPYDIVSQVFGNIPDDQDLLKFRTPQKFTLLDYGHQVDLNDPPAVSDATSTLTVNKNGVAIGTIKFFTNGEAAIDINLTEFEVRDKITIHSPALPDINMKDLSIALRSMIIPAAPCGTLSVQFNGGLLTAGVDFNPAGFDAVTVTGTYTFVEWAVISYSNDNTTFYPLDNGTAIGSGVGLVFDGNTINYNGQYYETRNISPIISESVAANRYYKVRLSAFGPAGMATATTVLKF